MKPAIPQLKSFENAKTLGNAFQHMHEHYPPKAVSDVIDEFTLMRIERESNEYLKKCMDLNSTLCLAYVSFFKGDIFNAINAFESLAETASNPDAVEIYLTILAKQGKFSLYEKAIAKYSEKMKQNLFYNHILQWCHLAGQYHLLNDTLLDMRKKNSMIELVDELTEKTQTFQSLILDKGVSISEYQTIKKHMISVLESNNLDFIGLNLPSQDSFIVLVQVRATSSLISKMNIELADLLACDEGLSLKLTAGFTNILPSYGVNVV